MRFRESLKRDGINIIAEFKRASPSMGVINASADPAERARLYESGGAAAMSVLCDAERFSGSVEDLRRARAATGIPLLAKDFISTGARLREVREAGADAALLIVRFLTDELLRALLGEAHSLGLDVLVETHSEEEIGRAVDAGAGIIGVNCRDLKTFTVDTSISERLLRLVPDGIVKVAESGVKTREDIARLAFAGADAFLVGTTLMKSDDPVYELRRLAAHG